MVLQVAVCNGADMGINRSSLKVKREGAGVNRGCFVGERSVSEKTSKSTKGNGKNWKYYKQLVKIAALKNGGMYGRQAATPSVATRGGHMEVHV
ncbi:hypothetical protein PPTG_23209 [Phytophthora nicotianae INRA-310]|uniref:Uncharacterized protein n=1 Tax=Phytophthora nicotianae (strain INRA-310) TaxID=761204 RepID=W2Q350_PHYN3|nr:hypothetical protein PPTG_23209 [Phytophthora nicotianae INRA-310]ETN07582.1 hypothetical protein PPTG_23209 [Phytophthora nicotianae INRA-310]